MKIFPKDLASSTRVNRPSGKEGKISRKKAELPMKKELSASEIKEKLATHVQTSDAAKNMTIKNSLKLGENFMGEVIKPLVDVPTLSATKEEQEIKTPNSQDLTLKTDIALNDPRDTNTQEKLKSILSKGAFNFNPKEKEALEKILS